MNVTVEQAAVLIRKGEVVVIPTETVYGMAADAMNAEAVKKTFRLKGRPSDNPLIVHISDINQLRELTVEIPPHLEKLASVFWPGPLTFVLRKSPKVPDAVSAGLDTVAVRMPDHPLTLELINKTGPLTAPSANRSGKPSPTKPAHILSDYGDSVPLLDGGNCRIGLESTVLNLTTTVPEILRPGAVSKEMIEQACGITVTESPYLKAQKPVSPGVKYSHYKPEAAVRWGDPVGDYRPDTYYLIHSAGDEKKLPNIISYNGDFGLMARELYDQFRTADHLGYSQIVVEKLPDSSISPVISALKDRITRASE
jgi:L-threonylcarbamoyladenylate synthase